LRLQDVPWLQDHRVLDDIVFPAAAYVAMVGEAIRQISGVDDYSLKNLTIKTGLVLEDSRDTELMTTLKPVRLTTTLDSTWYEFSIASYNGSIWTKHCTGQGRAGQNIQHNSIYQNYQSELLPRKMKSPYSSMRKVGLNYGEAFQGLNDISAMPGEATAVATLNAPLESESVYQLHPTTIDYCEHHRGVFLEFLNFLNLIRYGTDFL
jgi:acyl transferase domain-containing protein